MGRCVPALTLLTFLACAAGRAQTASRGNPGRSKPGDFLGLHFAAVPEVVYAHVPRVRRGTGVVVEQVRTNSPADLAGLQQHDILLAVNGQALTDADQLVRLLQSRRPQGKVALVLLRRGKEMTLDVNLPQAFKRAAAEEARQPRGTAKEGPAITCRALPMPDGKMQVRFEFYGKQVTFRGSLDEIETQAKTLPAEVQDLARVALDRLRTPKK